METTKLDPEIKSEMLVWLRDISILFVVVLVSALVLLKVFT